MEDYSLIEKINMLMDIITSSPLFLFCSMLAIAALILYIICIKTNTKFNKWIFITIWIVLVLILLINYMDVFANMTDNMFENIFKALYFPNLTLYIIILAIVNSVFFYSVFSKKIKRKNRIINFVNALIIDLMLVFIIDIVQNNSINVHQELTVYSNPQLLVLLELTSGVFTSWLLILLFVSAYGKLKKYDTKDLPKMPEIIFD